MRSKLILFICLVAGISSFGQGSWTVCNAPAFNNRIDDVYMVNEQTGYAVSGDGKIVKTVDGGENWTLMLQTPLVYCRSVEFINEQKGFVGGFPALQSGNNALRRTIDGGQTWTDLSPLLHQRVRRGGICGLSVADENTIYGGGNWFQDSAYLV